MEKYTKYEKYKPSSVDWLDEIPKHWGIMRLKFGYEACLGKMLTSVPSSPEDTLEPYLRSANILWGNVDISDIKEMYFSSYEKEIYSLKPGDLVVSEGGDVGRAAIWNGEIENCYIQNAVHRIRGKNGFLNKFLYYWLFFLKAAGYIDLLCSKATIAHLTLDKLRELPVYNPPIEEQKQIARFLGRETTRIDTLITRKRQLIDLLQKKRSSIINEAVTKGLNSGVDLKDSGISFIGKMPKHWEAIRLKFVVTHVVDCLHSTPKYDENGDYPAIRTSDVSPGILDVENANRVNEEDYLERIVRLKPEAKDVIYSREGERFGMAALVPKGVDLCLAQRVMMFRVAKWIDPTFFMWTLNAACMYHQVKQDTVGATSPRVNIGTIVEAWLPIPPKDEQEEIGLKIAESCLKIDKVISRIQEHILMLEKLRQALITNSVTGKIDVREEVS